MSNPEYVAATFSWLRFEDAKRYAAEIPCSRIEETPSAEPGRPPYYRVWVRLKSGALLEGGATE